MLKTLDLFSGIGGFSLGLERTGGFQTVAFCEIEPFCRQVLRKHWPDVPIYDDVRELNRDRLDADGIGGIDVICGGFPCQDISVAGKGAGIEGERSGLWSEFARLIGELRPRYAIVENVPALLGRGLARVLGDLAEVGFDAEWHCIPASAVGAPHRRDRVWIVAYPEHGRISIGRRIADAFQEVPVAPGICGDVSPGCKEQKAPVLADAHGPGLESRIGGAGIEATIPSTERCGSGPGRWLTEPDVGRVAYGVPLRVDRLRGLGNAVVPQIPELIGRAILEAAA